MLQKLSLNILWKHDIGIYVWVMFGAPRFLKFGFGKLWKRKVDIHEHTSFSKLTFLKFSCIYFQRNYNDTYPWMTCCQSIFQDFGFNTFRTLILVFLHASYLKSYQKLFVNIFWKCHLTLCTVIRETLHSQKLRFRNCLDFHKFSCKTCPKKFHLYSCMNHMLSIHFSVIKFEHIWKTDIGIYPYIMFWEATFRNLILIHFENVIELMHGHMTKNVFSEL